jgi:hypothetical protein
LVAGLLEEVDVGESSLGEFAGGRGDDGEGSNRTGTVMYVMARLAPRKMAEMPTPRVAATGVLMMLEVDAISWRGF